MTGAATSPAADPRRRSRIVELLSSCDDQSTDHLFGPLLDHLLGVEALLRRWGATDELALAGLSHATYGTDGFDQALLGLDRRDLLAAAAGPDVEATVYRYASCDRGAVYPQLETPGEVVFRDRFTGAPVPVTGAQLTDFVDLTLANEVELAAASPGGPGEWTWLDRFCRRTRHRSSPWAYHGAMAVLHA